MVKYQDDFVMTISDNDEILSEEDSDNEIDARKRKTSAKHSKTKEKKVKLNSEIDPSFLFNPSSVSTKLNSQGVEEPWDFSDVKKQKKLEQDRSVDIDERINQKRSGIDFDLSDDEVDALIEDKHESKNKNNDEAEKSKDKMHANSDSYDSDQKAVIEGEEEEDKETYFAKVETPEMDSESIESFHSMNLSRPLHKSLQDMGFVKPTPIQISTIPLALMGKDICGSAVTGSGKTAAFLIPILEKLQYRSSKMASIRVLILCPTRELAIQCHSVGKKLGQYTSIEFCLCVGGLSLKSQHAQLKANPDIIVATPGRLIDHIRNSNSFSLDTIETLVLDEADKMLDEGFKDELEEIIKHTPLSRQTMLFSATMTDNVKELSRLSLRNPIRLFVDPATATNSQLTQEFVRITPEQEASRLAILCILCSKSFTRRCILFFKTKSEAHKAKLVFGLLGLKAAELHGNLSQTERLTSLEAFRDGQVDFMLCTELAARGIDIKGIETVINFDMPNNYQRYIHRVGRTARAGRDGRSVTLVSDKDRQVLKTVIQHTKSDSKVSLKQRVISEALVSKYQKKLDALKDTLQELLKEEVEDKQLKRATMEVTKAENLLKHKDQIMSRPARTWFKKKKSKK